MAEAGILQDRRHADPTNENKWTLRQYRYGRGHGPIYKISKWIEEELPDLVDLNCKQSFEKKEMTPEDIMVLLGTFWTQARHIPCLPQTRVTFHCAILIAGIDGFRPGEVMNLKYRQVAFELVRDPRDPLKQRFSFCVTTIPYKPICLVSLLLAQAIANQAFKADFKSLADILERPNLGQIDSLPLSWPCDPDAPLYLTEADIEAFESRQDLTDLCAAYRDAVARTPSDDKDAKCIAGKITWIRKTLAKEQLRKMRNDYFERTDRVRALAK
ncbi:Uu.00g106070.m01.CDS01 [Anthostomella pinea]|uniref:Uu.00g106070.m01.CDS01 n=1 Tax=Anthostomella pinea TaxID=933095 RepID=A0AAI8VE42_9PEZI|nr:Uu.00g106070.m01.CDS01 [Anthostomella pinea]